MEPSEAWDILKEEQAIKADIKELEADAFELRERLELAREVFRDEIHTWEAASMTYHAITVKHDGRGARVAVWNKGTSKYDNEPGKVGVQLLIYPDGDTWRPMDLSSNFTVESDEPITVLLNWVEAVKGLIGLPVEDYDDEA